MDAERHRRIRGLFDAAVALPARERAAYLECECGDDAELRREVEELIFHDVVSSGNSIAACVGEAARVAFGSSGAKEDADSDQDSEATSAPGGGDTPTA